MSPSNEPRVIRKCISEALDWIEVWLHYFTHEISITSGILVSKYKHTCKDVKTKWIRLSVYLPLFICLSPFSEANHWDWLDSDHLRLIHNIIFICSLSHVRLFGTLWTARLPCPSPSPGACSNSCPLSWWCHPPIMSSVVPFSSG